MSRGIEFTGRVTGGKLPREIGEKLVAVIRQAEGKTLTVTVAERKRPRSGKQNRYYFGVVVRDITIALRELGNSIDEQEAHDFLKDDVAKLKRAVYLPSGEVRFGVPSSASLTAAEFARLIEVSRVWALQELGIDIPPPDPFYHIDNNREE